MDSSLRVIVTGLIGQHPLLGGITWHYLQFLLGLNNLGHDVYYFEDSGEFPYDLDGGASGTDWIAQDCTYNVGYLAKIMTRYGFEERWAYQYPLTSTWYGLSDRRRLEVIRSADLLINVSGSLERPGDYRQIPHLLYIDTDPVVTQIKIALGNALFLSRVEAHDTHFSFGEKLSDSTLDTEYHWRPTRQPIVLTEWRPSERAGENYTTVMNWASYAPLVYSGRTYGQKDVEFKRFLELPNHVAPVSMEVAISRTQYLEWQAVDKSSPIGYGQLGDSKTERRPRDVITSAGWRVADAIEVCGDLDSYRDYIERSRAEWSVAKNAYVVGRPGWFSERSACYLAAGRPVVVQDTGFASILPVGEGILSFSSLSEAVAAIREVETNYGRHTLAAREIAEVYFDSSKVLSQLIDEAMSNSSQKTHTKVRKATSDRAATSTIHPKMADSPRQIEAKELEPIKILRTDLRHLPAVKAWGRLRPERVNPEQVEILKQHKRKGAVYRLVGVGPGDSPVIAKRCRHEKAVIERAVYEEVLSRLPLTKLHYYGSVEEEGGRFWWLFLEDAGRHRYSPFVSEHRAEAAVWLGAMHTAAVGLKADAVLPDRGADHYLTYLRAARRALPRIRLLRSLKATDQVVLRNIVAMCEFLETNWDQVESFCDRMPRTFVHGDCLAKNVHVRTTQEGLTIAPFDWGGAGWGLPATDLGQLALPFRELPLTNPDWKTYLSAVRGEWPSFDVRTVQQLTNLGQLFWSIKVISRGVPEFDNNKTHLESLTYNFRIYETVLSNSIRSARWRSRFRAT